MIVLNLQIQVIKSKLGHQIDDYMWRDNLNKREMQIQAWRSKIAVKEHRRSIQKKLFGDHYNYSKVGLNKEKKYMLQQQRNTQIERSNRILLQKIQRISKRSVPVVGRKRIYTQQDQKSLLNDTSTNLLSKHEQIDKNINKSDDHLEKISIKQTDSTKGEPKLLFKGSKDFDGKLVLIKTYVWNGKFTIAADFGRMKQKVYIQIDQYRIFFQDVLGAEHSKILQYLEYNGHILQLIGVRKQTTSVKQREEVILPQITAKTDQQRKNIQEQPEAENSQVLL